MPQPYSAALPVAQFLLRFLVVFNWLTAGFILVLLLFLPHEEWIMRALSLTPSPEADHVIMALQAIAVVGLFTIPLNHVVFRRLLAVVATVREGDPFILTNANRLQVIAWSLLTLQLLGIIIAAIADHASTPEHPLCINAGFSFNGWLAVLLTFVLARVFAAGARMREDLEGTV